jgi:hypothetical protein
VIAATIIQKERILRRLLMNGPIPQECYQASLKEAKASGHSWMVFDLQKFATII